MCGFPAVHMGSWGVDNMDLEDRERRPGINWKDVCQPTRTRLDDGTVEYRLDGELHRMGGPAQISGDLFGTGRRHRVWKRHGKLHREDGPAVINGWFGSYEYWLNGKKHRKDLPAVVDFSTSREYRLNRAEWWLDGKRHRGDGPAIHKERGHMNEWWLDGEFVRKEISDGWDLWLYAHKDLQGTYKDGIKWKSKLATSY